MVCRRRGTPFYDFTLLPSLGGSASSASDINEAGQIVGGSKLAGDIVSHATLWTLGSAALDLAPSGGATTANRINDRGQIIGAFYPNPNAVGSSGEGQSLFWQNAGSAAVVLAPLPNSMTSDASGINNAGRIVGTSYENSATAFYAPHPTSWNPPTPIVPTRAGRMHRTSTRPASSSARHSTTAEAPAIRWCGRTASARACPISQAPNPFPGCASTTRA